MRPFLGGENPGPIRRGRRAAAFLAAAAVLAPGPGNHQAAPETEEVREAAAIPPEALGNPKLAAMGLVDVTAPPFGADPTGRRDATAALQKAVFFAREHRMAVFFPAGTYRVSDTLRCPHGNYDPVTRRRRGRDWPCVLVGSRSGRDRPKIVLAPHAPGFGDPARRKYVVQFWSWDLEGGGPPGHQDNINMNQLFAGIDIVIGEGNPGAVGIRFRAAQGSGIQDCSIDATHGYSGLEGGAGSGGGHYNVTIRGGRIGADLGESQPAPTIAGFTLVGQTRHALLYNGRQTLTAVGCRIVLDGPGPAVVCGAERSPFPNGQVSLVDSSVEFRTPGDHTAFGGTSSLYLHHVFVKGARWLCDWGGGRRVEIDPGDWTLVREYAHGRDPISYPPRPKDGHGPFLYASPVYLDGTRSEEDVRDLRRGTPPDDLAERHRWGDDFPSWERADAANVKEAPYGAAGDGKTDDAEALQRAIDAHPTVFLPKGRYAVSRTLRLKPHTRLLGLHGCFTLIEARRGGDFDDPARPRPVLATADDREAPTVLAFLGISAGPDTPGAFALDWRCGRRSLFRGVNVELPRWGGRSPVIDFPLVRISGRGGGRWYNFFQESWKSQGPRYRHLLVEGTDEPLHIYQCNPEHSRSEANLEIRNARHVSLYGVKGEYCRPIVSVSGGDHVRIFGYGGNASAPEGGALFVVKDTPNFLIANLVDSPRYPGDGSPEHFAGEGTDPRRWHMVREERPGREPILSRPLDRPVLVRRGWPEDGRKDGPRPP